MTELTSFPQPLRILVFAAHQDDIEFVSAGTLAKWIDEGAEVTYCTVTNGASGSNDPNIDLNELVRARREEQQASAKSLGVKDVIFLDYPDGILEPTMQLRRDLTRVIRKVKPFRVLCPDPTTFYQGDGSGKVWDYINHPDHIATGLAALPAIFPSAESRPIFPELLAEGYNVHHVSEVYLTSPNQPNLLIDISKYMDRKIASLLCHRSQVDEFIIPLVRKWDEERGQRIGCQYAEDFQTIIFY